VHTKIRLGNYLVEIPMLMAKFNDEYILGVDFLEKFNLENTFESVFDSLKRIKKNDIQCFRVDKSSDFDIPSNIRCLFEGF